MARLIAIDLGTHAVKVSVFQGSTRSEELEGEASRKVPQDGAELPGLADRLAILDLILRDHPDWSGQSHLSAVTWPAERSSLHRLKLPFAEAAQIEQTLPFAVESEVPFDLDEMVMAWRKGRGEGEVVVTLVPEDGLRKLIGGLEERGLDPRRVHTDGEVLASYAPYDDAHVAVLDVGHAYTNVVVARGGHALAYRTVSVAGRSFTKAIQDALGSTWAEAEALKHGLSDEEDEPTFSGEFDTPDGPTTDTDATDPGFAGLPAKARDALDSAMGQLLAEVRSTLVQVEDEYGIEIDHVLLTGSGSRVPQLKGYLEQDLGVPVRGLLDADGGPVPDAYCVSRALGRYVTGDSSSGPVDLRVGDLAYRGGMDVTRAVLSYGGALLGFFLVAVLVMFVVQYRSLAAKQAEVEDRIRTSVSAVVDDMPDDLDAASMVGLLADLVYDARAEAEFLGDAGDAPPTIDLLRTLTRAFPDPEEVTVDVDRLEITRGGIQIQGQTSSFAQVDLIGQSIQEAGVFGEVQTTPGSRETSGQLSFTIDIARDVGEVEGGDTDAPTGEEG